MDTSNPRALLEEHHQHRPICCRAGEIKRKPFEGSSVDSMAYTRLKAQSRLSFFRFKSYNASKYVFMHEL